jgi:2-keto-4-pentenoate hydratase/2-oxohepta-3-ene-1,7-dioic acid hydratase in catechol pathway
MRLANLRGRLAIVTGERALDVERASSGRFASDPQAIYDHWVDFTAWAETADLAAAEDFAEADLEAPVPRPRQVFAIGLNYADHAAESDFALPDDPVVFTKFPGSIGAPNVDVELSGDSVDYEVELVVVIGVRAYRAAAKDGWDHVAGLTIGQDISDREVQRRGPAPQFSLGKSFTNYGPIGPVVVTLDEFADRDAIGLTTQLQVGGTISTKQDGNTRDLIFSVPELIARLSAVTVLYPGDIIFTGTPSGVGLGKNPPEYLHRDEVLISSIEGIGTIHNRLT